MKSEAPLLAVLQKNSRGSTAEGYAQSLRDRLPGVDVQVARTPSHERALLERAEIATGVSIDKDLIEASEHLRYFACAFAGYDHLPLEALRASDVAVTTGSGIHAPNVAEWVIGHILVFARNIHIGWEQKQERVWQYYRGLELKDSTVLIVGLGSIGSAVASRLEPFDVTRIGVRYTPSKGGPVEDVIGYDPEELLDAVSQADYIVLTCPLTEETTQLIDETTLSTARPDSVIINAARGGVVDTDALVHAIRYESIRGAALDVTAPEPLPREHPLWDFDNILITPHNAGGSPKLYDRLATIVANNVRSAKDQGKYRNLENQII